MKKRLFIAIELPKSVKLEAGKIEQVLSQFLDVRWVDPDNIHLTLKFLGYVEEETIAEIENRVAEATQGYSSFTLSLSNMGAFPTPKRPRVIWVGLTDEFINCEKMQRSIDKALSNMGFEKEKRPFQPHVTLCRIKGSKKMDLVFPEVERISFEVNELILFESRLTPKGAFYTPLKQFPLKRVLN